MSQSFLLNYYKYIQAMSQGDEVEASAQTALLADDRQQPEYGAADGAAESAAPEPGTFARNLGTINAFAIVISIVIGSGIFTSPGSIDANVPSPGVALVIWLVGGALAWTGASTLAELGTAIPGEGLLSIIMNKGAEKLNLVSRRRAAISPTYLRRHLRLLGGMDLDCRRYACDPGNSEHCLCRKHLLCQWHNRPGWKT